MGCSARLHPHDNPLKNTKASGHPPRPDGLEHSRAKAIRRKKPIKDPISFYLLLIRVSGEAVNPNKCQFILFNYTYQKMPIILQAIWGYAPL